MNFSVVLFFLNNVFATTLLGGMFTRKSDPVLKNFGIGLLLDAVAFAFWSAGVLFPNNLLTCITIGAICFLISLVFFVRAATQDMSARARSIMTGASIVAVCGIFFVGRYVAPADAFISPEGFLFFNLTPLVQMLYIFALALASFPAIDAVSARLNRSVSNLVKYGLITEIAGGILLITITDTQVLYMAGWVIGLVYFILWTTLLFRKNAWSK